MSFKSEKPNSSRITIVNQNLAQDLDPDLDPNSGPSQGVKVGPDLDQTPGRDVKQNQENDHLKTNPGPDHLQKVPGVPAELEEINPGQGHQRARSGPDLHPSHLSHGNLKCTIRGNMVVIIDVIIIVTKQNFRTSCTL